MGRLFAGADKIDCAIGANAPVGTGSYTMIWLYKITLFAGVGGLGSLLQTGSRVRTALVTGNKLFGTGDFSSGFPASALPEDTWIFVAQSKTTGAAHYTWAYGLYPIVDPNTDIIFGEAAGSANHGDPGAGDAVSIGLSDVGGSRTLALQAFFAPQLTQAQIKTAFSQSLSSIMALGPTGCWPLNQANITDPVLDVTGHGADQTAISGTTVAANPPGYNFSLANTVLGTAAVNLGGLSVVGSGTVTRMGTATVNLGTLATSASAITGGPVILPDDFYSPGPCRPYDYVSLCPIPTEAAAVSGYALEAASEIVFFAGGQQFDTCQVTIRPCRKECYGDAWPRLSAGWWDYGSTGPWPALINGLWYNIACGFCGSNCSCSVVSETILPGPIREIVQVTIDGQVLDPVTDYRLDDYRKLVRLGGNQWPLCNDLNKSITETGTWSVTMITGLPLPTLGKFAVGQLFCDILNDLVNNDCSLPDNVTDITRQGLSFTLDDVQRAVESGFDTLKYVNKFIERYNPHKLAARPRLYDIDAPDFRVTGTVIS
jgi:hypothetical protein